MAKSEIKCPTPKCVSAIEKYGANYHMVVESVSGNITCEYCGGRYIDGEWVHQCASCHEDVEPGKLTGLFVPHKCSACEQKQADEEIQRGAICRMCRKPYSRCCC